MKIYTKKGDEGKTSVIGGEIISKSSLRVRANGELDELNSQIGVLVAEIKNSTFVKESENVLSLLNKTQNLLFEVGSEIASPKPKDKISNEDVEEIERAIDSLSNDLPPLNNFILPGGCKSASMAHVVRTIARRCERTVVGFSKESYVSKANLKYLNRISDYFFTLARFLNNIEGFDDVTWISK